MTFALTTAAPSADVAPRWGDWHLAEAVSRALQRRGHDVRVQSVGEVDEPVSRTRDVQLVVRGKAPVRRTVGQRHVLWVISHPDLLTVPECDEADLVLVASERFAAELRGRTRTPVATLLQATDVNRFAPRPVDPAWAHPVTIVANARHVLRPIVADALAAGLRPAIVGRGWDRLVDPALVVAEQVPNDELATVYSSTGVLLNDHWADMRAHGFVSNRLFDALACATPVISDDLPELASLFGPAVATYTDPADLRDRVAEILDDPDAARRRASVGRDRVVAHHTFDHRAAELLHHLAAHGLDAPPS
jgi:glycosyltransferase involved in cell wall biosynthesis